MKPITTLEELREQSSEKSIAHIMTEYLMEICGKANKFDEIIEILDKNGTIKDMKSVL